MDPIENKVVTIDDFIEQTKGMQFHYCSDKEDYSAALNVLVNTKLRNAIGHNDVDYDSLNQLITYVPNSRDRSKRKNEYLLQFESEAIQMFQAVLCISEYLYHLRKLELMYEGKRPAPHNRGISKQSKIGRNEPCPCGSGKKYKICHGSVLKIGKDTDLDEMLY